MQIFVQLPSWLNGDVLALLLNITQHLFENHITYNVHKYNKTSEFRSTKSFHSIVLYATACSIYKPQARFCDFSGVLTHSQATSKVIQHVILKTVSLMFKASSICDLMW